MRRQGSGGRSRCGGGEWSGRRFPDRFGPLTFAEGKPMDVAPHPHIGLQTVTWLAGAEIVHHDRLGYEAVSRPGGVSVMTAGPGDRAHRGDAVAG